MKSSKLDSNNYFHLSF